ncbi:helix-turn-helix domain-containing protein [Lacibacterium aquatile]|uniref:Helix-turn-helix domain-containing protein n=1 Tax=Lacibacterium aquatile TaxID=1168082 RepID=A0ABW5DPN5_9PROT
MSALGEYCYSVLMSELPPLPLIEAQAVARGTGWRLNQYLCRSGPQDRPFEERHEDMSIALVTEGSFRYSSDKGGTLLHPGALLLGNAGSCYECGHDHSTGDRCLALHIEPEFFGEVAASVGATARFRFPTSMLPAFDAFTAPLTALMASQEQGETEEAVIRLVEGVVGHLSTHPPRLFSLSSRDHRRIDRVLRFMETNAHRPLDLDELAAVAIMSKYHFLRSFRGLLGCTPYAYLLELRLRRAALQLTENDRAITDVAYDSGFPDLSTFNNRFRRRFGEAPSHFRARYSKRFITAAPRLS